MTSNLSSSSDRYRSVVIAIDGPAGAGKSTVSKLIASRLGIAYLDTGAMYRALALVAGQKGLDKEDESQLAELLDGMDLQFGDGDPPPILVGGQDVSGQIRTPEIGQLASDISKLSEIRKRMVALQQRLASQGGVILEGRDVTTVVAPNATLKIYLTASLEERAKRRQLEFMEKGMGAGFEQVRQQIMDRDHQDITRKDSPLSVAEDAEIVESAGRSPQEVADLILDHLETRLRKQ